MRATTLNSYLYRQFADDDDLQALVEAYNEATQYFIDWFNTIQLPDFRQQAGGLLDWVANGLYGQQRTQLATPITPGTGAFNTEAFNTEAFNAGTPSSQTFYNLTDDVFQRILTWNYYKGDGRAFSIPWLKRRIMRFLLGTAGIDPQPWAYGAGNTVVANPNFAIGAETTTAVSVTIAGGNAITVTIDQSALSLQAGVAPGVAQLFRLAFIGGILELPLGYAYTLNIVTNFDASVTPDVLIVSGAQSTLVAGPAHVMVLGGSGIYTYAWAFQVAGLGGIAAVTSAAAAALRTGVPLAGVAAVGATATAQLLGAMGGLAVIGAAAAGTLSGAAQQALAGVAIASSGATATFAGAAQVTIDNPLSATTTFTARGLAWGQTLSLVGVCTVTDAVTGAITQATVALTFECLSPRQLLTEGGSLALPILIEGASTPLVT